MPQKKKKEKRKEQMECVWGGLGPLFLNMRNSNHDPWQR
jgi:hypothetical protein